MYQNWVIHNLHLARIPLPYSTTDLCVHGRLYGEELFTLAQILAAFEEVEDLAEIASLEVYPLPPKPHIRSMTWQAIAGLNRVIEDVQMVQHSVSRSARSFALNRAQGELKAIQNQPDQLPEAERALVIKITRTWQEALLNIVGEVGQIAITEPLRNPYVIGDPVQGSQFVGREDILRQLEELWVLGNQLQSVVLYGHRRMGKTSILVNAADSLGAGLQVAYVNLLRLGDGAQGVGEVLLAITDEISEAVNVPAPADADMLQLPYRTFERYLKQVETVLGDKGLIIALDEFEKIEELIEAGKVAPDFMGYLRGLVHMSSKVAFAFAGLHTLDEMTEDYFHPFFASIIPIRVDFLSAGAVRQLLANPNEDFPLDYHSDAYDLIQDLTSGQPYLVQLIGFQLVRRYNNQVFEQGRPRDPVFTVEDVQAVIQNPEFFTKGRYYFSGVWKQASQDTPHQQTILQTLAPHPEGISLSKLVETTGLAEESVQAALKTLRRHDVAHETEQGWVIIVELFRRWVLEHT